MICIYSKNNIDYTKNGDAVLIPTSAYLQITINGAWQLKLTHPYDAEGRYKYLIEGAVIQADVKCIRELGSTKQRFRIYNYTRNLTEVEIIAFPVAMEANFDAPVDNIISQNETAVQALSKLQAKTNKYTLTTDLNSTGSSSWSNSNIHSALAGGGDNCYINVWGGEIIYDNLNFKIRNRIGDNTAADHKVTYGDNLTNIAYEKDDSGLTTRIYPVSQDGIRLDGTGYVESSHAGDYPVAHSRYFTAPYTLVNTDAASPTNTAVLTRQAVAAVTQKITEDSHTGEEAALDAGIQPEYIKSIRSNITDGIKNKVLQGISSSNLYNVFGAAIDSATAWLAELEQPEWGWMGDAETGWKYGNENGYAKNQYIQIGKTWSYFGADGVWQEPRDDKSTWDWHQGEGTGKKYGNFEKYYAHNEFVYITENGTLNEYWFNEQGWYESGESGASDWSWHGSGTAEEPWWFGETDAGTDSKKYAHDCWLFIDGTLYFFDSYGYYDGTTKFESYQWDWVQSDERWWFGNAEDEEFAAVYLQNQWAKINGAWCYFDAAGYLESTNDSIARTVAYFTGAATTATITNWRDQLYGLLYSNMRSWAQKQYTLNKIDMPAVTITVDMADLSKTTEYQGLEHLQTIKLGDSVECTDSVHGISTTNRIIGLNYDIIREYNETVVIGSAAATVSQILGNAKGEAVAGGFDTSAIEAQISAANTSIGQLQQSKQDKLTAGDNITIINNRISSTASGRGLEYWTETEKKFFNTGMREGMAGDSAFFKPGDEEVGTWVTGQGWQRCIVIKLTANKKVFGGYTELSWDDGQLCYVSKNINDLDFLWGYSNNTLTPPYEVAEWNSPETYPPYVAAQEGSPYYYGIARGTFQKDGETWHALLIDVTHQYGFGVAIANLTFFNFGYSPINPDPAGAGRALLEAAHGVGQQQVTMEIATETDIIKYYTDSETIVEVDEDGNANFNEITTAAGTLSSQMARKQNNLTAGDNITINNDTISANINDFTGATAQEDGEAGLVPAPEAADREKFLKGDGTWATPSGGGGGSSVVPNPAGAATDELQKIQIDNTIYSLPTGGSADEIYIFKDGDWINQSYINLTAYNAAINGGKLVCSGMHAGVVVDSVAGFAAISAVNYSLIITVESNGVYYQTGRCNPTNNLDGIIRTGANRLSYTNDTLPAGVFKIKIETLSKDQGVFFGGYYLETATQYNIIEIKLIINDTKAYN